MSDLTLKGKFTLVSVCMTIIKQSFIKWSIIQGPGPQSPVKNTGTATQAKQFDYVTAIVPLYKIPQKCNNA